jgi:hypothetical protein
MFDSGSIHSQNVLPYRGADKSLARPGRKQATSILSLLFRLMQYVIHITVLASALGFKTSLKFHLKTFAKTLCGSLSLVCVSDTSVHLQGVFLDLG